MVHQFWLTNFRLKNKKNYISGKKISLLLMAVNFGSYKIMPLCQGQNAMPKSAVLINNFIFDFFFFFNFQYINFCTCCLLILTFFCAFIYYHLTAFLFLLFLHNPILFSQFSQLNSFVSTKSNTGPNQEHYS